MADPARSRHKGKSSTKESEVEDTATSHTYEGVCLSDIQALDYILTFHSNYKVFPWDNQTSLKSFVSQGTRLGIGNVIEWNMKFEHLRNKWWNQRSRSLNHSDQEEYGMWKKIWGWDGSNTSSP
ncbi:hypothetical protein Tco_1197947 [Tanacetum coccineum]